MGAKTLTHPRRDLNQGQNQLYDGAGNLTLAYANTAGKSYLYKYDHLNRLTAVYDSTGATRSATFTYDALGRRIEHINDRLGTTLRYYYDGANELLDVNQSDVKQRYYVHGLSYIDERVMMYRYNPLGASGDRPFYYAIDRDYSVAALVDRGGPGGGHRRALRLRRVRAPEDPREPGPRRHGQ